MIDSTATSIRTDQPFLWAIACEVADLMGRPPAACLKQARRLLGEATRTLPAQPSTRFAHPLRRLRAAI